MDRHTCRKSVTLLVVLVLTTLTAGLAIGCGASGGGGSAAAGTAPKSGGSLTLAYQSEPTTLDPAIAYNIVD